MDENPSGVLDCNSQNQLYHIVYSPQHTIVYSGFSHLCFWQCSDSIFTGNFPVHDAPPIIFLTSGLLGVSPSKAGPSTPLADDGPLLFAGLFGFGSLSEFENTIKLSSPFVVVGEGFLAPPPPPGFPPFAWPFLTILSQLLDLQKDVHVVAIRAGI